MSNPKLKFLPGTVIKSQEQSDNFNLLFNKRIVIPLSLDNITPAANTYSLTLTQRNAIASLLPLDSITSLQITDITQGLTLNDIVDVIDHSTGESLRDPFPDSPTSKLIFGKLTTITTGSVIISFYKDPDSPTPFVVSGAVDLLVPVKSAFHALPEDFLRKDFVNTFETDIGENNDIDRLFDNTGVSRSSVDSPNLKTDFENHRDATSGVHGVTGDVVGTTDTQTLTNKTFIAPIIISPAIGGTSSDSFTINDDGNGAILDTIGLTGTHTYTFPDVDQVLVGDTFTQTLTNKTLTQPILTLEQGTIIAPTQEGRIAWDTDDDVLKIGDGTGTQTIWPTVSIPALDADVVHLTGTETITGLKTFSALLTINGGITSSSSTISLNGKGLINLGSLIPFTDNVFDLGENSTPLRWRSLYLAPASLHIVSTAAESGIARDWNYTIDGTGKFHLKETSTDVAIFKTDATIELPGTLKLDSGATSLSTIAFESVSGAVPGVSWGHTGGGAVGSISATDGNTITLDSSSGLQGFLKLSAAGNDAIVITKFGIVNDIVCNTVLKPDGGISATGSFISFNSKDLTNINTINTHSIPSGTDTFTLNNAIQTLTNKTLTSPVISTIVNIGTLTLPTSTDTLVGRNTTDTLTNKTLTSPTINGGSLSGGTIENTTIGATTATTGRFTTVESTISTGTAPLIIASTTKVTNLNTDLFDDLTSTDFVRSTGSVTETITGLKSFTSIITSVGINSTGTLDFEAVSNFSGSPGISWTLTGGGGGRGGIYFSDNNTLVVSSNSGTQGFLKLNVGGNDAVILTKFGVQYDIVANAVIKADGGISATGSSISFNSKDLTSIGTINTHTIPGGTDTFTLNTATQILTNKTLGSNTTLGANLDANGYKIVGLADPTAAQDATTKFYVDSISAGLDPKASCRIGTLLNIPGYITGTITIPNANATYFPNAGAAAVIDGITLSTSDRILVKNQTDPKQNGIYSVANAGVEGTTDAVLNRSTDMDGTPSNEVSGGNFTYIETGTQAGTGWVVVWDGNITLDTDPVNWTQFSDTGNIIAGDGLTKTGNTLDVVGTTNRISVFADNVDIASTYIGQTSITTLGTIIAGTWNASTITVSYGGTGATSFTSGYLIKGNGTSALSSATPDVDYTTPTGTETLTNKTLGSGTVIKDSDQSNTLLLPDLIADGFIVVDNATQTLSNKTISFASNTLTNVVSTNTDQTISGKKTFNSGKLEATNIKPTGAGTNGHTVPAVTDDILALLSASQTLINKTIDDSTNIVRADKLSTTGSPVVVSASAPPTTGQILTATSATNATWQNAPSNGHVIQDEGISLTTRTKLNFTGSGITATDDPGNDATVIFVPISNEITSDDELVTSDIGNDTEVVTIEYCPAVSTAIISDATLDSDTTIGDGISKAGVSISTGRVDVAATSDTTITVKIGTGTTVNNIYSINFIVKGANPNLVYLKDVVGNNLPISGNTFVIRNDDAGTRSVHFQVFCD